MRGPLAGLGDAKRKTDTRGMETFKCPEGHDGKITLAQDSNLEAWVHGWHNGNLVIGAFQDVSKNKIITIVCRSAAGIHEIPAPDVAILQDAPTYLHDRLDDIIE